MPLAIKVQLLPNVMVQGREKKERGTMKWGRKTGLKKEICVKNETRIGAVFQPPKAKSLYQYSKGSKGKNKKQFRRKKVGLRISEGDRLRGLGAEACRRRVRKREGGEGDVVEFFDR